MHFRAAEASCVFIFVPDSPAYRLEPGLLAREPRAAASWPAVRLFATAAAARESRFSSVAPPLIVVDMRRAEDDLTIIIYFIIIPLLPLPRRAISPRAAAVAAVAVEVDIIGRATTITANSNNTIRCRPAYLI